MKLEDLKKELPYKTRPGSKGMELAYIDARQVMDCLDECVGAENWKDSYFLLGDTLFCTLSIKVDGEWIGKTDCGTESNSEAEKGQVSDAFKRAAVKWGVGRFLYSLGSKPKHQTVESTPKKSFQKDLDVDKELSVVSSFAKELLELGCTKDDFHDMVKKKTDGKASTFSELKEVPEYLVKVRYSFEYRLKTELSKLGNLLIGQHISKGMKADDFKEMCLDFVGSNSIPTDFEGLKSVDLDMLRDLISALKDF